MQRIQLIEGYLKNVIYPYVHGEVNEEAYKLATAAIIEELKNSPLMLRALLLIFADIDEVIKSKKKRDPDFS